MYNTDDGKPPKRPVISSQAAALSEIRRWQRENQLEVVRDGDGLVWTLSIRLQQIPDPSDPRGMLCRLKIGFKAMVSAEDFLNTGTLDPEKDRRLLSLIGDATLKLSMKPATYTNSNEEAAKATLIDVLPKLTAQFRLRQLGDVKRRLLHRWVDERCRFGGKI